MKVFSMFSGIGGFDLAMEKLGHEIVGACEIDTHARQIYAKNFPGVPIHNDATQVQAESLPQFDVLCGGFPCQAFSIAGKRRGFSDTRGSLFFEIARIAKEKQPSILFLENVKGLLSHDKGETFRTILSSLDEVGYSVEWQVFNSKHFVPQNRERLYIIGHLRGKRARQVFPLGEIDSRHDRIKQSIVPASTPKVRAVLTPERAETRQAGRRFKKVGEPAFSITTQDRHGVMIDNKIRRLTPVESERLQGFPDNWTEGISDTQRYKCCGNAVTVPVVQWIASHFEFPKDLA